MPRANRWTLIAVWLATFAGVASGLAQSQTPASNGPETLLERAYALDSGKAGPRDAAGAAELYRQASLAGDAYAHLRLGYLYETGDGVLQDYDQARAHYQAAVDSGVPEAHLRLAICDLEGWGGAADRTKFASEMRAAAEADYIPAQRILATMYAIGFAVPKDPAAGVTWLEKAAAQDDAASQVDLGRKAERGRILALMPDISLARKWYQLSAEQEYQIGMRAMARTFLVGPASDRNWSIGEHWLELATDAGDAEAPYILAVFEIIHPDVASRDVAKAEAWLKLAAGRGNVVADEILELQRRGRPLVAAVKYVIEVPYEERYISEHTVPDNGEPTRQPQVYRLVKPIFPLALRMSDTTGKAVVDFIVDPSGHVVKAKAVSATHPLFGERAVEAVEQWRFRPGRFKGKPVPTHMQVPIIFQLEDSEQLRGADSLIAFARNRAELLGGEIFQDAADLTIARPRSNVGVPVMNDGSALPADVAVVVLLVLDASGTPIRGHILKADPETAGPPVLQSALAAKYRPRMFDGKAEPSNAAYGYVTGRFKLDTIKKPPTGETKEETIR